MLSRTVREIEDKGRKIKSDPRYNYEEKPTAENNYERRLYGANECSTFLCRQLVRTRSDYNLTSEKFQKEFGVVLTPNTIKQYIGNKADLKHVLHLVIREETEFAKAHGTGDDTFRNLKRCDDTYLEMSFLGKNFVPCAFVDNTIDPLVQWFMDSERPIKLLTGHKFGGKSALMSYMAMEQTNRMSYTQSTDVINYTIIASGGSDADTQQVFKDMMEWFPTSSAGCRVSYSKMEYLFCGYKMINGKKEKVNLFIKGRTIPRKATQEEIIIILRGLQCHALCFDEVNKNKALTSAVLNYGVSRVRPQPGQEALKRGQFHIYAFTNPLNKGDVDDQIEVLAKQEEEEGIPEEHRMYEFLRFTNALDSKNVHNGRYTPGFPLKPDKTKFDFRNKYQKLDYEKKLKKYLLYTNRETCPPLDYHVINAKHLTEEDKIRFVDGYSVDKKNDVNRLCPDFDSDVHVLPASACEFIPEIHKLLVVSIDPGLNFVATISHYEINYQTGEFKFVFTEELITDNGYLQPDNEEVLDAAGFCGVLIARIYSHWVKLSYDLIPEFARRFVLRKPQVYLDGSRKGQVKDPSDLYYPDYIVHFDPSAGNRHVSARDSARIVDIFEQMGLTNLVLSEQRSVASRIDPLNWFIKRPGAFVVSDACERLIEGLEYHFKRDKKSLKEGANALLIEKNRHSHTCEAACYGAGFVQGEVCTALGINPHSGTTEKDTGYQNRSKSEEHQNPYDTWLASLGRPTYGNSYNVGINTGSSYLNSVAQVDRNIRAAFARRFNK